MHFLLALLAGGPMFQNRINTFVPALGASTFTTPIGPAASSVAANPPRTVQSVSLADIYQAAMTRAIEDIELDKLFNPDFYDYQI
jgi:hypothetical protein